jgi:hypothetical protein
MRMTDARIAEVRQRCEITGSNVFVWMGRDGVFTRAIVVTDAENNDDGLREVCFQADGTDAEMKHLADSPTDLALALDDLAELRERVRLLEAVAEAVVHEREVEAEYRVNYSFTRKGNEAFLSRRERHRRALADTDAALAAAGYGKEAPDAHT